MSWVDFDQGFESKFYTQSAKMTGKASKLSRVGKPQYFWAGFGFLQKYAPRKAG